jgi:E1-E2 ATPase
VLLLLTLLNAVLGLNQEGKAAAAVDALQKMMIIKAKVHRGGDLAELPAEQLVPGDIVSVEAGDIIPADGRLLQAATLEVAESALTGESVPVSKGVEPVVAEDAPLGDRTSMVFMNTNTTRGTATFVVTATGMETEVGHISGLLESEEETETPLTRQLRTLTNQILLIAGAAVALSMILNLSRGDSFDTVFTAAIAFAVSAIPTGLPAVVTTILSLGTQILARANAIVKRLRSTETLGSTSAINSDKTGTLTLNQMTAIELAIPGRRYTVSGSGYSTDGQIKRVAGTEDVPLEQFLMPMMLANDAVVMLRKLWLRRRPAPVDVTDGLKESRVQERAQVGHDPFGAEPFEERRRMARPDADDVHPSRMPGSDAGRSLGDRHCGCRVDAEAVAGEQQHIRGGARAELGCAPDTRVDAFLDEGVESGAGEDLLGTRTRRDDAALDRGAAGGVEEAVRPGQCAHATAVESVLEGDSLAERDAARGVRIRAFVPPALRDADSPALEKHMDRLEPGASLDVLGVVGLAVEGDEQPAELVAQLQKEVVEDLGPGGCMERAAVGQDTVEVDEARLGAVRQPDERGRHRHR